MDNINKKKTLTQINSLKKAIDKEVKKGNISGSEYKDGYLHGSIRDKKIKCGKKNCKCANGIEFGHGPYPHLQWWEDGKIKTRYLNKKKFPIYEKILRYQKMIRALENQLKKEEEKEKDQNKK